MFARILGKTFQRALLFALVLPIEKTKVAQQNDVLITAGINQQQVDSLLLENINTIYFLNYFQSFH